MTASTPAPPDAPLPPPRADAPASAAAQPSEEVRWLLLVHQIPSEPSRLRVRIWRRLQGVGAVAVKGSVWVLPDTAECREDYEWLRGEIVAAGGEAAVFVAAAVDELSTDEVVEAFRSARAEVWRELGERAAAVLARRREPAAGEAERREIEREVRSLRARAGQIDKLDFFAAAGRSEALAALAALEQPPDRPRADAAGSPRLTPEDFRGRRWVTRPRPGVDRMASAWLIRRFIDPSARFELSARLPPDGEAVPFDMFGVELGHHGDRCTFETLLDRFGLHGPGLERVAAIVHDLDLKTGGEAQPETATVGALVEGLRAAYPDDDELLAHGIALFAALHAAFSSGEG